MPVSKIMRPHLTDTSVTKTANIKPAMNAVLAITDGVTLAEHSTPMSNAQSA